MALTGRRPYVAGTHIVHWTDMNGHAPRHSDRQTPRQTPGGSAIITAIVIINHHMMSEEKIRHLSFSLQLARGEKLGTTLQDRMP